MFHATSIRIDIRHIAWTCHRLVSCS